jgi:hypothetical protein
MVVTGMCPPMTVSTFGTAAALVRFGRNFALSPLYSAFAMLALAFS